MAVEIEPQPAGWSQLSVPCDRLEETAGNELAWDWVALKRLRVICMKASRRISLSPVTLTGSFTFWWCSSHDWPKAPSWVPITQCLSPEPILQDRSAGSGVPSSPRARVWTHAPGCRVGQRFGGPGASPGWERGASVAQVAAGRAGRGRGRAGRARRASGGDGSARGGARPGRAEPWREAALRRPRHGPRPRPSPRPRPRPPLRGPLGPRPRAPPARDTRRRSLGTSPIARVPAHAEPRSPGIASYGRSGPGRARSGAATPAPGPRPPPPRLLRVSRSCSVLRA
ncbi:hypothetical protein LEMLEM_LOCUS22077 [Lemmus lemmus]